MVEPMTNCHVVLIGYPDQLPVPVLKKKMYIWVMVDQSQKIERLKQEE